MYRVLNRCKDLDTDMKISKINEQISSATYLFDLEDSKLDQKIIKSLNLVYIRNLAQSIYNLFIIESISLDTVEIIMNVLI